MGSDDSSSAEYIHMVQHLIEECIVFNMSKEECMETLSKHANIKPVITSTVWKELEKENKEFFDNYERRREEKAAASADQTGTSCSRGSQTLTLKTTSDSPRRNKDTNDDDDDES